MAKVKKGQSSNSCSYTTPSILLMFIVGAGIRYWLLFSRYQSIIGNHIEISTPLNSWKRISEGLYLQSKSIDPYNGDLLHEAPLTMLMYQALTSQLSVEIAFILFDIMTAILLFFVAKQYMFQLFIEQEENKKDYVEDNEFLLTGANYINTPVYVAAAFLFNPYTIFNCVGLSTMVFHNFFLATFLLSMLNGDVMVGSLSLALCSMISLYPVILIIPLFLCIRGIYKNKNLAVCSVILFGTVFLSLQHVSSKLSQGYGFTRNVYGFILTVPDLQPNIGLFWYFFFTEMFDHFRDLFIYSFQINATILYLIPLSIKFRKDPFLLTAALLFLISVFKSYPCLGDVGFILSLLPCFIHLFNYSQQGFLVGVIFLITSALGPILWHLWIYSNSANANFYFGVTLAFAIAQIFLVTDILFAYLKRDFCLKHGKERKIDGKDALLILE